jgi:hypothetical protein
MEELEGSEDEIDIGELDKHNKDEIPDKDPMQVKFPKKKKNFFQK